VMGSTRFCNGSLRALSGAGVWRDARAKGRL
jgi:hypothetical protein